MSNAIEQILAQCSGITVETTRENVSTFTKVGDIELPAAGIFIKILRTAAAGTIARVCSIDIKTRAETYPTIESYKGNTQLVTYDAAIEYEVEGRKQKGRIKSIYVKVLNGTQETKYVRDVKKHKKVVVKNPINKYKQEMKRGDWVIGVKPGKHLGIGRITRWTNANVWAVTGEDLNDNSKEFKFDCIDETFTMPNDDHVTLLTMAVLKGWEGK
jgi:hypothetical protein